MLDSIYLLGVAISSYEELLGNNTGFATLSIIPSGGEAPYTIVGGSNGQYVQDGDVYSITVTDANGCTSVAGSGDITIVCPEFDNCTPVDCSSNVNVFALDVTINNLDSFIAGGYTVSLDLTSSNYAGAIVGSYKIYGLNVPEAIQVNSKYHSAADYTPNIGLSDYMEFGFNQFTVAPDETDSPWSFFLLENAFIPDWTELNNLSIKIALYDDEYCVHEGEGIIQVPNTDLTNSITINF